MRLEAGLFPPEDGGGESRTAGLGSPVELGA